MLPQKRQIAKLEKTADKATKWIGSTSSLIVHTFIFVISFALPILQIVSFERMLLVLTTLVSLEAIYLSIFIQMSVNKNSQDIEIIQEDVGEIQEDIEEIEEDIDEIQKDVDEIQEDIEGDVIEGSLIEKKEADALAAIQNILLKLQDEIEIMKRR
jgi:peptidoglycan hydrolase CwlO-like protein